MTLLDIYQGAFVCNLGNEMSLALHRMLTLWQCVSAANYGNNSHVVSPEQCYFSEVQAMAVCDFKKELSGSRFAAPTL